MPIPVNATTDLWVAQDFLTRVVSRLFQIRQGDDPRDIQNRLTSLLEAANEADPNSNDYLLNDALRPVVKPERPRLADYAWDVVTEENDDHGN